MFVSWHHPSLLLMTYMKRYIKPVSSVIDLRDHCQILAGSKSVSGNPNLKVGIDDWDDENVGVSPAKRALILCGMKVSLLL